MRSLDYLQPLCQLYIQRQCHCVVCFNAAAVQLTLYHHPHNHHQHKNILTVIFLSLLFLWTVQYNTQTLVFNSLSQFTQEKTLALSSPYLLSWCQEFISSPEPALHWGIFDFDLEKRIKAFILCWITRALIWLLYSFKATEPVRQPWRKPGINSVAS